MSSHTIVYLDQNYLSNMAKARFGYLKREDDADFWQSLFDDLKKSVLADKIACPALEFQSSEAMFDRRLEKPIRRVIDELSWGLQFCHHRSIIESQVEDAALRFLGKSQDSLELRSIAFESDPQSPVESRMQNICGFKSRINVHFSLSDEITEHDRKLKLDFVYGAQELLSRYSNNPLDWSDALIQSKKSCIDGFMGVRAWLYIVQKLREGSKLDQVVVTLGYGRIVNFWNRLYEIGINTDDFNLVMKFMESDELLNSPFIDIFSSIYLAIATYYPRRRLQKGDFYDVPILATVLPYCDIVTTDSFMKEILVNRLNFDNKYKAKVFSATKPDRLAFCKFVRWL